MQGLNNQAKEIIKDASQRLTGVKRREYQAKITLAYFDGSARMAERELGWSRKSVLKGLGEAKSGFKCIDNYQGRGRKRTEDNLPGLKEAIISLAEPMTQADPAMKTSLTYTRITSKSMREALIVEKNYKNSELPTEGTIGYILYRLGYNLKRVQKSKPVKKIKEIDDIFENTWHANSQSDNDPESLRISIDAKAKVNIGEFSRNGKSRDQKAKKAADHDMNPEDKLVPYGILDAVSGFLTVFFVLLLKQVIS